jgi:hypothetical protein
MAIIKATTSKARQQTEVTKESIPREIKVEVVQDRKYLICIKHPAKTSKHFGKKLYAIVFDKHEQTIVYKAKYPILPKLTEEENIDRIKDTVHESYKRSESTYVSNIHDEREEDLKITPILTKPFVELAPKEKVPLVCARHKVIQDTYKYIDKYNVKLTPKFEHDKDKNITICYLHNDVTEIGIHKLVFDLNKRVYSYFFRPGLQAQEVLQIRSTDIEDIFK